MCLTLSSFRFARLLFCARFARTQDFCRCRGTAGRSKTNLAGRPCTIVLDRRLGLYCEHHKAQKPKGAPPDKSLSSLRGALGASAKAAPARATMIAPARPPSNPYKTAPRPAAGATKLEREAAKHSAMLARVRSRSGMSGASNSLVSRAPAPSSSRAPVPSSSSRAPPSSSSFANPRANNMSTLSSRPPPPPPKAALRPPAPPKPKPAAAPQDLLGAALSVGVRKSGGASLLARAQKARPGAAAKPREKVQLPSDGTYSGSVPIPQSKLGAAPVRPAGNGNSLIEKHFERERGSDEANVRAEQQRIQLLLKQKAAAMPLNSLTNKPARGSAAGAGAGEFGALFGAGEVDLDEVKNRNALGKGSLREMEQLKRKEALEALEYKEKKKLEKDAKGPKQDAKTNIVTK